MNDVLTFYEPDYVQKTNVITEHYRRIDLDTPVNEWRGCA